MLDSEKMDLIKQILIDFWENGWTDSNCCAVMLNAIATIADFKRKG